MHRISLGLNLLVGQPRPCWVTTFKTLINRFLLHVGRYFSLRWILTWWAVFGQLIRCSISWPRFLLPLLAFWLIVWKSSYLLYLIFFSPLPPQILQFWMIFWGIQIRCPVYHHHHHYSYYYYLLLLIYLCSSVSRNGEKLVSATVFEWSAMHKEKIRTKCADWWFQA